MLGILFPFEVLNSRGYSFLTG